MAFSVEFMILFMGGFCLGIFLTFRQPSFLKRFPLPRFHCTLPHFFTLEAEKDPVRSITRIAGKHEVAARLAELIRQDGAGSWPPRAVYDHSSWPAALRPYLDIYHEMASLLPAANPSLDDGENRVRIDTFRARSAKLLNDRVDLASVVELLEAAAAGRWDIVPRDVYNAFYCCIAWHRHAYRWATIPAVRVAQVESSLPLPPQLIQPWALLQSHFGLDSESGNMMSNIILNFSPSGTYQLRINSGLSDEVRYSEEEFSRVCHEVEALSVPVYLAMVRSIISYSRHDLRSCLRHMQEMAGLLRPALSAYYDRVHDSKIKHNVWLSHVQGFYAWGMGREEDKETGRWVQFDGLSGNQVLLFQAVDAFLGLDVYLSKEMLEGNVPRLQRDFCAAVRRSSFRKAVCCSVGDVGDGGMEGKIKGAFDELVKRMRVFRSAHRSRARDYLLVPAPERLPMTAGKSLLKADMAESIEFLDEFMVSRLRQTV